MGKRGPGLVRRKGNMGSHSRKDEYMMAPEGRWNGGKQQVTTFLHLTAIYDFP
jgi:hypothetical protein